MTYMTFRFGQFIVKNTFIGRIRSKEHPEKGRFNAADFGEITKRTWKNYCELLPYAPKFANYGNRKMMDSGVLSLAVYRAMTAIVDDRDYAIELAGDILWKYYAMDTKLSWLMSRVLYRDPYKQVDFQLRLGIKYQFCPPEYKWEYHAGADEINLDFYRCPICDYFKMQGDDALEFFQKTWCLFDFALPDIMADKGVLRYTRPHTLSKGDDVCDMKFTFLNRTEQ